MGLSKILAYNELGGFLILSFFLNTGVIFFTVSRSIDITVEVTPQMEEETAVLEVTFVKPKAVGVAGFKPITDQAEAFVPDDTCAWSIEYQQLRLDQEAFFKEQGWM